MKWLILISLLLGCGKHTQPAGKANGDIDGDQIIDGDEVGLKKFIADVSTIEHVVMTLKQKGSSAPAMNFSNDLDISKYAKELLVRNELKLPQDDYFAEWGWLKPKEGQILLNGTEKSIVLKVEFSHLKSPPECLELRSANGVIKKWDWNKELEIELSAKEVKDIQTGELKLTLSRKDKRISAYNESQWESIKRQTYRILIDDGNKAQIYYVSKSFSVNEVFTELGIESPTNITSANLLTTTHPSAISQWWYRQINGKDHVLIKADLNTLSKTYLSFFQMKVVNLIRENGLSKGPISFKKDRQSSMLLKIRGTQTSLNFKSRLEKHRRGTGGGTNADFWWEYLEIVEIASKNESEISSDILTSSILVDGVPLNKRLDLVWVISEGADLGGSFLELRLYSEQEKVEIDLSELSKDSFIKVGVVRKREESGPWIYPKTAMLNPESALNLSIEAYLEKL